jgi:dsDNA-specific endonuclease/ATPase MutS2
MPIFFPNNFFQKTDFDFILSLLKNRCQGEIGQASAENPFFYEKLGDLEQELKWVAELGLMINLSVQFPHRGFKQLASEIQLLKVEQAFLSINAFIEIYFLAEAIEILKKIASNAEQKGTFDIFVKKIKTVSYKQEIKKGN